MPDSKSLARTLQARRAANRRYGRTDTALDREYAAVKLETYIREVVATAPPLTGDQCDRLASLLRGGRDA